MLIRQGDILLRKIQKPVNLSGAKKLPRDQGRVVLAYGEVTGHSHAVSNPKVSLYALETNLRVLRVEEQAELRHEEHATAILEPGDYEVIQQRENTALGWRTVVD